MRTSFASVRNFISANRGAVAVMTAFALPVMLGFVSLAAEFGHGLLTRTENQRVADQAAYAAAVAYSSTSSTTTMLSVAQNVGALNGIPTSAVSATLVTSSPGTSTDAAVKVTVTTTDTLLLAPALNFGNALTIDASAYAQIPAASGSCVLALSTTGNGVTLSGGTKIVTPTGSSPPPCSVASNNSMAVPCGTYITANKTFYDGAVPTVGCGGISGTQTKALTSDPIASNAGVIAAAARAVSNETLTGPTMPTLPTVPTGTAVSLQYSNAAASSLTSVGCPSSTYSNGTWTIICPAGGTYNFGSLQIGGGVTVNFNVNNSATYNFSGSTSFGGSSLTFGSGTFNFAQAVTFSGTTTFGTGTFNFGGQVTTGGGATTTFGTGTFNLAKGLITGGGATTTFGAGTFNIGEGTSSCSSAYYSVCHQGATLTFGGPSTFNIIAGIYNGGGGKVYVGSGSTNTYNIGPASDGNALNLGGGALTTLADATGSGDLFQAVGNVYAGGGSCITLPAATNHDINGSINMQGGLTLGAGLYAVSGYAGFGILSGGSVSCNGANVAVTGSNVTLAMAGNTLISNSNCATGSVFCLGSGFSGVSLIAPTSGTYQNLAVIGPTSTSNTGGISFTSGASSEIFGGALYFPNGPMIFSGGSSISYGSGSCLQIVASQITLSGSGTATASQCFGNTTTAGTPTLVE